MELVGLCEEFFAFAYGAELFAFEHEGELGGEASGEFALGEGEMGVGRHADDEDAVGEIVADEWEVETFG